MPKPDYDAMWANLLQRVDEEYDHIYALFELRDAVKETIGLRNKFKPSTSSDKTELSDESDESPSPGVPGHEAGDTFKVELRSLYPIPPPRSDEVCRGGLPFYRLVDDD